MIKAEVVFDEDSIIVGSYRILIEYELFIVYLDDIKLKRFDYLERAIKYCLEN